MKKLRKTQDGMSGIGIMLVLAVLAGVVFITLRLFPLYNEKFQVVAALNSVAGRPEAAKMTTRDAGKSFMKSMAITNINRFGDNTIKDQLVVIKPKKKGEPRILHMHYEARSTFFDDIYFLMVFDKKIPLSGPTSE
ncbi:MAG: hypothetical protein ACI9SC_003037 [Gammaproteobacteria bacterium]|jgi:Tfp pilus assembly major pilin PilA